MYPHQHFKRTHPSPATDTTTQPNGKRSKPNPEEEHPHSRHGYSPNALCTRKIIAAAMRQDRDGRADVKGKGKMKMMARMKARGIGGGLRKVNGGRVVGNGSAAGEGAAGAGAAGVDGTGDGSMDLSDSQTVDREEIMDYDDEPAIPDDVDDGEEELSSTHPEAPTATSSNPSSSSSSSSAGPSKPPRNYIPIFTAQDFDSCTSDDEPFTPIRIFKSPAPPPSRPAQIYKSDFYRKPKANANLTKAKQTRLTILARNRQLKRSGRIRGYDGLKKRGDVHDNDDDAKISQDTEKGKKKKLLVPVVKKFVPTWYPKEEGKKE
ncbi:hypothetical protein BZA77DRAFT_297415 [Pyronema omphalodes]|nr:hypothetical protein BZA77DRAFT_297415 [Pyronema omphalodes]